jgi:hypothetical protein
MKKMFLFTMMVVVCMGLFYASPGNALTFSDDFNNSTTINKFWWTDSASGGNTISQEGGRLFMTQTNYSGGSGMGFNFKITGDFEMKVDYTLVNWPSDNYERVGLNASSFGAVERSQHPGWFGESYVNHFSALGDGVYTAGTTDLSGTLRMLRSGNTVTGSYWNGSDWTVIREYTGLALTNETFVGFSIWNGYASVPVKVAFDNFYISAPETLNPVPIPASALLLGPGLAGLAGLRRRFKK